MNSDSDPTDPLKRGELDALVTALRNDLPSEGDSVRLRARLSALGLAASEALVTTSAAATGAGAASGGAAALGGVTEVAAQAGGVSWALKASALAVVSVSAIAGPAWYVHERDAAHTAAANSAVVNAQRAVTAKRDAKPALPAAPGETLALSPSEGQAAPTLDAVNRDATPANGAAPVTRSGAARAATPASAPAGTPVSAAGEAPTDTRPQTGASSTAGFAENGDASASALVARGPEPTTLREETAIIDRALSALRAKDTQRAAALLADHERRFPNGLLAQERERAQRKLQEILQPQGAR